MPSAGQVDDLTVLVVLLTLACALGVVVRSRPLLGVLAYVAVIGLVPTWLGVSFGLYIAPTEAVGLVLVGALLLGAEVRLRYLDIVLVVLFGLVVVSQLAGLVTLQRTYAVLAGWCLPYLVARLLSARVEERRLYTVIAVVFCGVALLALVEFATGVNPFVRLSASNALYASWADIQMRGGLARAEGALGHSIALGGALALAIPFTWVSRLHWWAKGAGLMLLAGASFVTFSRIGMVSTALALVLCLVVLRRSVSRAFRVVTATLAVVALLVAAPFILAVFAEAGDEAAGSAAYRSDLLSLLPAMSLLGQSPLAFEDAAGARGFGSFGSIDSAVILTGLAYGWLPLVLLLISALVAVVALLRRRARSAPLVSVVALLPALTSVAFITQFTIFFWFTVGLAVSHVGTATERRREPERATSADTLQIEEPVAAAPERILFHPVPAESPARADG